MRNDRRRWLGFRAGCRNGFTLIEMLAALSASIILLTVTLAMVHHSIAIWERTSGALTTAAQAELVLDRLASDLESAWLLRDQNGWLAADVLPGTDNAGSWRNAAAPKPGNTDARSFNPYADRLKDCRFGVAGVWLRFFTTETATVGTVPRAVAYQVVRRPVTSRPNAPVRYQLYRSLVRPSWSSGPGSNPGTFQIGYDITALPYNDMFGDGSNAGAATIRRPHGDNVIASGVIDFGVRFFIRSETGLVRVFPLDGTEDEWEENTGYLVSDREGGGPAPFMVELLVRLLTPEGEKIMEQFEEGRLHGDWWQHAETHSRVFTRQVFMPVRGEGAL